MTDIARAATILGRLRDNPDLHDQHTWACGTAGCVAGHTIAHYALNIPPGHPLVPDGHTMSGFLCDTGRGSSVTDFAAGILGLTDDEAQALFIETLGGEAGAVTAEAAACRLLAALIARDVGAASPDERARLVSYGLPTQPNPTVGTEETRS